jgi:hypothetical protein
MDRAPLRVEARKIKLAQFQTRKAAGIKQITAFLLSELEQIDLPHPPRNPYDTADEKNRLNLGNPPKPYDANPENSYDVNYENNSWRCENPPQADERAAGGNLERSELTVGCGAVPAGI